MPTCHIVCLAAITLLFCGCGTLENLEGKQQQQSILGTLGPWEPPKYEVYGGIRSDLEDVRSLFVHKTPKDDEKPDTLLWQFGSFINDLEGYFILGGLAAIDLPFSLVGDTLSLPVTIQKTLEKQKAQ